MLKKDLEKMCMNQREEISMLYEVLNHFDIRVVESKKIQFSDGNKAERFLFENKQGKNIYGAIRLWI